jgi:hypothetical protein
MPQYPQRENMTKKLFLDVSNKPLPQPSPSLHTSIGDKDQDRGHGLPIHERIKTLMVVRFTGCKMYSTIVRP